MSRPTIDEITVADPAEAWADAGFDVREDAFDVGSVRIRLAGRGAGRGIVGCSLRAVAGERLDGLPTSRSNAPPRAPRTRPHPNGVVTLDHLVAVSPDLERTIAALETSGLELRRLREEPAPSGAPRQAFFRLGEVILEVVEPPAGSDGDPEAPARFWGLAFSVDDLERSASELGDRIGAPRAAVQPGRRIATLRRSAGLGTAVALMTRVVEGGRPAWAR
jgi:hypothetical protein